MKKCILLLLCTATLLTLFGTFAVSATVTQEYVVDKADLLDTKETVDLSSKLYQIGMEYGMSIVVLTVDTLEGKSPRAYADDFYDYQQPPYGKDGILLLVCTESNDWYISTSGFGITAFTDAGIEYISDRFVPFLSDGEYAKAFETYADLCEEFIIKARAGEPYDRWNLPKDPFNFMMNGLVAVGIGLVVAFIAMSGMKAKLNSVRQQAGASAYVKDDSLHIAEASDLYLYSTVSRVRRETSQGSSTHRSSSGRSHGGGGGKF